MTRHCRSCDAPIVWCVTDAGRKMPVDAEPSPTGNLVLVERVQAPPIARPVSPLDLELDRVPDALYVSHFATCPDAQQHRRRA